MRFELRSGLAGDRRELRIDIGPITVTVTEVPGISLSDQEWRDVRLARLSFVAMWGDSSVVFERDRFDGRGDDAAVYDTKHYLAWVEDGVEPAKLVTSRKVLLRSARLTTEQRAELGELLPLDIRFWRDRTTDGPLWPRLRAYACSLAPDDELAEFRIASMGRVATYPFGERGRTARQRERTAIAWAATQVLAAHDDPSLLWVWTIRPEFQDKVMVVHDLDGNAVRAPFVGTDEVLGLPAGAVVLDRGLPVAEDAMLAAPGYFFDNGSAAQVLATLLDERRLTMADLRPTIARLVEWEAGASQPGRFRASVFEFRPYPGTPEWNRLLATGKYDRQQLLDYTALDLTEGGLDEAMRGRDEFNFSVNIQFGEAELPYVRRQLVELSREQHDRSRGRDAA